ncbi:YihY/virulence factor BrkB family protein [Nocardioides sp.]|uniref:YihY/virulence factor BrkB family protein n=1 Tax=Nocardioides sp. TaxID=35761 RepID=UPI002617C1A7|nr:YihY/virulence factor BrkB family protein [Nocardioides sp.]MDI6911600.1 YihY/virulence factor BrkB family protein [Nocardioides sp.]
MSSDTRARQARRDDAGDTSPDSADGSSSDHAGDPDSGKIGSPTDLTRRSWFFVARKTVREFSDDQCTDLAAALTYYAVLAVFPAAIALTSLLGLVGQGTNSVETLLGIVEDLGGASMVNSIRDPLIEISRSQAAGLAFVLGLAGALWSASGYVGGFSRAMNRIYEIREGRPVWKLRPLMLLLTLVLVVLAAVVLLALVVTGPVADSVGSALGVGSTLLLVWNIAKWPVIAVAVVVMVALLYYATPNVRQPKFRWVSVGAVLAILTWALVSAAFGYYVANVSSYDKTYGALGGVIAFLLWVWLTNLALLFGAELDAELERGRELQSGIPAERFIQLPPRDTRNIDKARAKDEADERRGRAIRLRARRTHARRRRD